MTTDLSFKPIRGQGPVGTGVHLLRRSHGPSVTIIANAWLTVLFVPVIPFGEWTVNQGSASSSSWLVTHVRRPRFWRSVTWVAGGVLATIASLVPAYCAITFFMGSKAAELGGLFCSAGAIIGTLGWLDQTRERVPFRIAVRAVARGPSRPDDGSGE